VIGFFACEVLIGFGALRAGAFIGVVACAALFCLFAYGVGLSLNC